jgi:hypothetical protein
MKNFEFEEAQLIELDANDLQKVNGGWWQAALAAAGAGIYVYNNWGDFCRGFREGAR